MLPYKWLSILLPGIFVFLVHPVYAEGPAEFYNKGYAHTPFDKTKERSQKNGSKTATTNGAVESPVVEDEGDKAQRAIERRGQRGVKKANVMDDSEGIPILSIGVIVDVNDKAHYDEVTSNLIKTLDRSKIFAGTVYTLASFGPMSTHNYIKLHARGASLLTTDELPQRFQTVKLSPTYILQTKEGEILLEAVSDLDRFINAKGEFLEDPDPLKPRQRNAKGDAF